MHSPWENNAIYLDELKDMNICTYRFNSSKTYFNYLSYNWGYPESESRYAIMILGRVLQVRAANFFYQEKKRLEEAVNALRHRYGREELPALALLTVRTNTPTSWNVYVIWATIHTLNQLAIISTWSFIQTEGIRRKDFWRNLKK